MKRLFVMVGLLAVVALPGFAQAADLETKHDEGLQIGPTAHFAIESALRVLGGVGIDVSFKPWIGAEAWLSGVSRPDASDSFPKALSAGMAANLRAGGETHKFVYGLGLRYMTRFECPNYCSVFSAMYGPEEDRTAEHLVMVQARLGYEARLASRWFMRGLATVELPISIREIYGRDLGGRVSQNERYTMFTTFSFGATVGYAFGAARRGAASTRPLIETAALRGENPSDDRAPRRRCTARRPRGGSLASSSGRQVGCRARSPCPTPPFEVTISLWRRIAVWGS